VRPRCNTRPGTCRPWRRPGRRRSARRSKPKHPHRSASAGWLPTTAVRPWSLNVGDLIFRRRRRALLGAVCSPASTYPGGRRAKAGGKRNKHSYTRAEAESLAKTLLLCRVILHTKTERRRVTLPLRPWPARWAENPGRGGGAERQQVSLMRLAQRRAGGRPPNVTVTDADVPNRFSGIHYADGRRQGGPSADSNQLHSGRGRIRQERLRCPGELQTDCRGHLPRRPLASRPRGARNPKTRNEAGPSVRFFAQRLAPNEEPASPPTGPR